VLHFAFFFDSTSIQALIAFFGQIAHNISYTVPAFKPNDSLPAINHKISSIFPFFFPFLYISALCLPESLKGLRDTNIVGLKLVQAHANSDSRNVQTPPEDFSQAGVALLGDVVNDDGLEADVRVQEDGGAQDGVGGGVERSRGEGRNGEGHEAGGKDALEGPVV
jgi:hypothetical protein